MLKYQVFLIGYVASQHEEEDKITCSAGIEPFDQRDSKSDEFIVVIMEDQIQYNFGQRDHQREESGNSHKIAEDLPVMVVDYFKQREYEIKTNKRLQIPEAPRKLGAVLCFQDVFEYIGRSYFIVTDAFQDSQDDCPEQKDQKEGYDLSDVFLHVEFSAEKKDAVYQYEYGNAFCQQTDGILQDMTDIPAGFDDIELPCRHVKGNDPQQSDSFHEIKPGITCRQFFRCGSCVFALNDP